MPSEYAVLIVGASRGLGLGLLRASLEKRHDSHIYATARNPDEAAELKALAAEHKGRVSLLALDATSESSIASFVEHLPATLDSVWIVAGINAGRNFVQDAKAEDFRLIFDTNVVANHAVAQAVAPRLIASQAEDKSLVFYSSAVSSLSMWTGVGKQLKKWFDIPARTDVAYATSKAALNSVVLFWRDYLLQYQVKVVAIHPGLVISDMTRKALPQEVLDHPAENGVTSNEDSANGVLDAVKNATFESTGKGVLYWNETILPW